MGRGGWVGGNEGGGGDVGGGRGGWIGGNVGGREGAEEHES